MKRYKPTSSGQRGTQLPEFRKHITKSKPLKKLSRGVTRSVGRNSAGRITSSHRGGGHKRLWREIDFTYNKKEIPAKVEAVEYDPNRSGFIGLVLYADGERRYVLLPQKMGVGDSFIVSLNAEIKRGNRMPLYKIPVGTFVYNVELKPNSGGRLARSAGNYAEITARESDYVTLKMPSSEIRKVLATAWASIGEVSNDEHRLRVDGKAGRSRWRGTRPKVRGSAMNPVDHPHGGGEGRAGRGHRRSRTATGRPTGKGQKTRRPKKYSNNLIVQRRKVGKKRK
jgi:large subunit ribosomal protein L2